MRTMFGGIVGLMAIVLLIYLLGAPRMEPVLAQDDNQEEPRSEPAPPAGQTYIGTKKCASCHFEQFLVWRKDKHSKAFDILPEKYKTDASCLKCHTTGFGKPTGYKTSADTDLAGTTCEVCHGPGSKHEEICKPFASVKKLSPQQEAMARDSIYKVQPRNICIDCHTSKAHKAHPKYDK